MQLLPFIVFYPLIWIISKLSFRALYVVSDLLFYFIYYVLRYRRKTGYNNLNNHDHSDSTPKIIGPFEAPIKKLRNRFRWQLLLKADNVRPLLNLLYLVFENPPATKRDELIQIDVDPHNLM